MNVYIYINTHTLVHAHIYMYESESRSVMSDSLWPHGLYSPWNSPGQNIGVCSLSLLQGIFPSQGLNPHLPLCKGILYQLSYYMYLYVCVCVHVYIHTCCFCSVTQLRPPFCELVDCSIPGLPSPHHLPEFVQIHVHCIGDAIQPSHPLMPSSPSALNLSQHQELFQWIVCSHQMTKILELQLQHQCFQQVFRIDFP